MPASDVVTERIETEYPSVLNHITSACELIWLLILVAISSTTLARKAGSTSSASHNRMSAARFVSGNVSSPGLAADRDHFVEVGHVGRRVEEQQRSNR